MFQNEQAEANLQRIPFAKYSTFADPALAIVQKATFGLLDWRAAAVGRAAQNLGATRIVAHSQGTLLATGMMLRGMLPRGSTFSLHGPAANWFTVQAAGAAGGYNVTYQQKWFDWVNIFSAPGPNLLKSVSGFVPVKGLNQHVNYPDFFRTR